MRSQGQSSFLVHRTTVKKVVLQGTTTPYLEPYLSRHVPIEEGHQCYYTFQCLEPQIFC